MSIERRIDEMKKLSLEVKKHRECIAKINARKKTLSEEVIGLLKAKGQTAVEYKGTIVGVKTVTKRTRKKKENRLLDIKNTLQKWGINDNHEKVMEDLKAAMTGGSYETENLQIKRKKK